MILVDTSVWVDHLRAGDAELATRLQAGLVLAHAHVIGYVDAHLLAAVLLTPGSRLWTRDRRLLGVAKTMGLAMA